MTSAARVRRHRERGRDGLVLLRVVVDEVRLLAVLQDAGLVSEDPERDELAQVVSRWIDLQVTRYERERWAGAE